MNITEEMRWERVVKRYRGPDDSVTCQNCGAVEKRSDKRGAPWWCRRHKFWVNARGCCPKFNTEAYCPMEKAKQTEIEVIGDLFEKGPEK